MNTGSQADAFLFFEFLKKLTQLVKSTQQQKFSEPPERNRIFNRCSIMVLVILMGLALLLGSSGFQTYWRKERRLIAAADEIVAALKAYSDASPGTVKDFPLELADLAHDPRMLAEVSYLSVLPVDPVAQNQEWGVVRNDKNQVIGVHSRSNEAPTLFAKLFSFREGKKYADWKFTAE